MAEDSGVVVLGEDVGRGGIFQQYKGLQQEFGAARVIDTPISEATIMGAAVGMALAGLKPVVEMRVVDFALCAMDEIVNQAAKARYMFGGQGRVPLVRACRSASGAARPRSTRRASKRGSRTCRAWWSCARPRRRTTIRCSRASIDCGDPVIYMEHKELWGLQGEVPTATSGWAEQHGPARDGRNAGHLVEDGARRAGSEDAPIGRDHRPAHPLAVGPGNGVRLRPRKPERLLVVHEAVQAAGFGAEIAATVAEEPGCR